MQGENRDMKLDPKLLEANRETEILSAYIAADRIEASLKENSAAIAELARMMHAYQPEQILFVGSGASYCTLYTGYYYLRTAGSVPVRHFFGPELIADDPPSLRGSRSLAILASYSGKTADTVAAGAYLKDLGVPRIALGREEHSPLAGECEHVLAYHDKCLYTSAMANLLVLLAAYLRLRGEGGPAEELERAVQRIPDQMRGSWTRPSSGPWRTCRGWWRRISSTFWAMAPCGPWHISSATRISWSTPGFTPPACVPASGVMGLWRCCSALRP
jgi:glucosamine 6-phosphate synthetase-like amidotransferase/phosphosugar isomerase protein